jgi:3-phenylpropionate/trans-cinnamate dioxygenase ferredoxin reductase subunit
LIVGGGIAGTTAAASIRRTDDRGRIVVLTAEPYRLYTRMALPSLSRGQTSDEQIILRDDWYNSSRKIELWTGSEARFLDAELSILTLADGRRIHYDKLLLAGGSHARRWNIPGADLANVVTLRSLDDARAIRQLLPRVKHALVVGGGFIALDQLQTMATAGVATTAVMRGPHFWSNVLDEESASLLHAKIDGVGHIHMRYGTQVEYLGGDNRVEYAVLSNGRRIETDLVLAALGTEPCTEWLESSGVELFGGVVTDACLKTNVDNIWAAGDIALFHDTVLGSRHRLGNWHNAAAQGEIAGHNMTSDEPKPFEAITSYFESVLQTDICFVGDVYRQSGIDIIPRGSARSGAYGRILVRGGRAIGATLINRFAERGPVERLIRSQRRLSRQDILDLTDESVPLSVLENRLVDAPRQQVIGVNTVY